jgi:dTDP-4-dehydrorhamnose reductase
MKVLVLGCRGQVGRELTRAAWGAGTEVVGLSRPQFDITSPEHNEGAIAKHRPQFVINAAAYTAVDKAESDLATAFAVNDHGPLVLAATCCRYGIPLIHLSTDYVFDGCAQRPYRESDAIGPINAYGRSKAAGEAAVRLRQPRHIILRTAWVYASHGQNFVRTMLRLAAERDEVSVVADQFGTPTSAPDIVATLVTMLQQITAGRAAAGDDLWGTYHFTAAGETTWHDFAACIFRHLERNGSRPPRLKPISTSDYPTPARRPANSRLDCTLIEQTFGIVRTPWQEGLNRVLEELAPIESAATAQ